jgi:hypothetical protein
MYTKITPHGIGTDEDFNIKVGKDITYSEDNKEYRIYNRIWVGDEYKYYLRACDINNPVQRLQISRDDESKMTVVDCPTVIERVWPNVKYTGNHSATMTFILENIMKRCDVKNRNVKFYLEGDVFKMDFDEHTFSVTKT